MTEPVRTENSETAAQGETAAEGARRNPLAVTDWRLAVRAGSLLVPSGPRTTTAVAQQTVRELLDAAARAEGPVRDVSKLFDEQPASPVRVVDRPRWIAATADSMAQLSGTDELQDAGWLAGKPAGVQLGAILAFLSTAVLGQYDPFVGENGTLLLLAPNIVATERLLRVSPTDFRLWVCLHEITHRVQFSATPWLTGYMRDNIDTLFAMPDEPLSEVLTRVVSGLRRARTEGPADPTRGGTVAVLRALQGEPQRAALDRMLVLGTLLEGHADHVMDAVGPQVVPSVAQIRAAFQERRRRGGNPIQRLLRVLLGLDAKIAQYVRGKAFVDEIVETVGMTDFNTVWTSRETLPLPEEINEPGRWIARVLG